MKFFVIFLIFMGCATDRRSTYGPLNNDQGYMDKELENSLRLSMFRGNHHTKVSQALMFAKFRALEVCQNENKTHAFFIDSIDQTHSEKVTHLTNHGYPAYYYSPTPFYNRPGNFSFGLSTMRSQAWEETRKFPRVEVVYQCVDKVNAPLVEFREVPPDELKHLVKDLRGGLQVEKVSDKSPNKKLLKLGDIILRANGERIQQIYQVMKFFNEDTQSKNQVDVLRDGETLWNISLKATDVTEQIEKSEAALLRNACEYEDLKERGPCLSRK